MSFMPDANPSQEVELVTDAADAMLPMRNSGAKESAAAAMKSRRVLTVSLNQIESFEEHGNANCTPYVILSAVPGQGY